MLDYRLDRKHYSAQFSGLTLIYNSDKEHVAFLSFPWTYNFSCQIKQSQGDMRLEIYYYLEYRRFLPSQFYSRQIKHLSLFFHSTNRLIGTVKFCFQNRKLKDMQVLLITRLLAIDPELLNEAQFVYMHVIDK